MNFKDYIQGKRHGKEANKLEQEALNDAFLHDAIDGYDAVPDNHLPVIEELEAKIATPQITRKVAPVWRWVAAIVALLLVGSLTSYYLNKLNKTNQQQTAVATHPTKTEEVNKENIDSIINTPTENIKSQKNDIVLAQNSSKSVKAYKKHILPMQEKADDSNSIETTSPDTSESNNTVLASKALANDDRALDVSPLNSIANLTEKVKNVSVSNALQGSISGIAVSSKKEQYSNILGRKASSMDKYNDAFMKNISGKVTDEQGEPLIGATVAVKGKNVATVTDINGYFNFQIPSSDSLLVASYIGYEKTTLATTQNMGDIKLLANNQALNEVVVVGYGSQKRKSLTGTIFSKKQKQPFTQRNFIAYFKEHYNKDICSNRVIDVEVKVKIDEKGTPLLVEIIKTNCPEIKNELEKYLQQSPAWSIKNQTVIFEIQLKNE